MPEVPAPLCGSCIVFLPAFDFISRAFQFDDNGWIVLFLIATSTLWMLFAWIDHWGFRITAIPAVILGAVFCHQAMGDLQMHVSNDKAINFGVGFGTGVVLTSILMSTLFWLWYELAGDD